jgi:hypothetical protein
MTLRKQTKVIKRIKYYKINKPQRKYPDMKSLRIVRLQEVKNTQDMRGTALGGGGGGNHSETLNCKHLTRQHGCGV